MSSCLAGYANDRRAAISPMMVFLLIPLCGIMALAGEVSFWFVTQRALQNAADSAALAAAANNDETTEESGGSEIPRYEIEALAVARAYGFANGENNVTVTTTREEPCLGPDTEPVCYRVVIRRDAPLYLTTLVGYQGDVTHDGRFSKIITSEAVASRPDSSVNACIVGLASSGTGIDLAGSSTGFDQCDLVSNAQVECSSVDVDSIFAPSVSNCGGENFIETTTTFEDPYAGMDWDTLVTRSPCTSTPLASYTNWSSPYVMCSSNRQLTGNVTISDPNAVIVVVGQTVDLNGFDLMTGSSASATIIFTSSGPGVTVPAWFTNSKSAKAAGKVPTVAIAAPTSGDFQNFALVGDPSRPNTTPVSLGDYKHGSVEYNMNTLGVVYAPNTDISADGNVRSDLNTYTCISIVANRFTSNGGKLTANSTSECAAAGIIPPQTLAVRTALVR